MPHGSPHRTPTPAADVSRRSAEARLAGLLEIGFERVDPEPLTTESARLDAATFKVSQVRPAMGSLVTISALHASQHLVEDAIGTAFEEMDRVIRLLNRFDSASALSALNDTGRIAGPPPELAAVIDRAIELGRQTGGAFDVTVKPLIDLYRDPQTYEPRPAPSAAEMRQALELVGSRFVAIDDYGVRLGRAGMGLTLDGIAKGYIVDAMAAALRGKGATRFLINAGGDIRASGDRGDDTPWTVAIRDPDDAAPSWDSASWQRALIPDRIRITAGAVATSGSYEVYFDSQRQAHHIIEGRSGRSPAAATSVTVVAPTTMQADALATAVFVLGPKDGRRLVERTAGAECMIIDGERAHVRSRGWSTIAAPVGGEHEMEAHGRRHV